MTSLVTCLAVCLASTATLAQAPARTEATTAPASNASLRAHAVKQLLNGDFKAGHQSLIQVGEGNGKMCKLVATHLQAQSKAHAERGSEYAAAVNRVALARLAQEHHETLVAAKLNEKLFDAVNDVADDLAGANRAMKLNPTSQPAEVRDTASTSLDKATAKLKGLGELIGAGHGRWGKSFHARIQGLRQAILASRSVWATAELPRDWRKLRIASERVQDRLIDLGVLVSRDPIASALNHAREAKELSGQEPAEFTKAPWVVELMNVARGHGDKLVREGKWEDALSVYGHGGLSDLAADPRQYEQRLKRIGLHVRMSSLYGEEEEEKKKPTTAPAEQEVDDDPRWIEMMRGIDVEMIRKALGQVDRNYVDRPDYRRVGIGALRGIKVLLETPEVVDAFPDLENEPKRLKLLGTVDKLMESLRREHTVDYLHVKRALEALIAANGRTVDLPSEVINLEFTEAMLAELDRFTGMIWPYEQEDFQKRTMGSFCGIGVQIRKQPNKPLEVVTPLADSPALKAGIRAGDLITAVDGKATMTITVGRAVKMITGKPGRPVSLKITRPGTAKPFVVEITREVIHIRTVKGWRRLPDTGGQWDFFIDPDYRIGYIRLTQFTSETIDELRAALKTLRKAGVTGVILDLRFNPGGLLTSAVDVADEFLRRGLIVRTKGRNVAAAQKSASPLGGYQSGMLVVLANQYSASAAEIVSGALKDWKRATIIGRRTFGKGSVQRLIPLQPNRPAKLKLTTAYYYLPGGTCLHRKPGATTWGVDPHIEVPMTIRQMNRAAEIRLETSLVKDMDEKRLGALLTKQLQEDLQLRTALLVLRVNVLASQKG